MFHVLHTGSVRYLCLLEGVSYVSFDVHALFYDQERLDSISLVPALVRVP
jgi:hypothetical protein